MKRFLSLLSLFLLFSIFAAACNPGENLSKEAEFSDAPTITQNAVILETSSSDISLGSAEPITTSKPDPADPADIPGYHQSIPLDGIRPVYNPQFATSDEAATLMFDDELVMGVAWDGEAKAYPVTVLRFREIVNDELAGIPTLVTW